jgi:DNA helicase II / ATP-dependent DNA helicase PcrA
MAPTVPPAASFPGPAALGRGAVVAPGAPTPPALAGARRVVVDDAVAADPGPVAAVLHHHWVTRTPVVVELATDNEALRAPEVVTTSPLELPATFHLERDRLFFLLWANTYDCRAGAPVWWHGVLAERRCGATRDDTHDVRLADGTPAWVDGGPRGPVAGLGDVALVHRESVALGRATVLGLEPPADALAPDQLDAVTHAAGPARIVAPAGSGKTRVLTARLRHLLRDRGYEPELVTAVAYNTRAAQEMRERTGDLRADVRTIHSLAYGICRAEQPREVISERDVRTILDRLVTTARVPNTDPYQPYLEALSQVRLGLVDPAEVEAVRDDVDGLTELVPRYREELRRRNVVDFDEQVFHAIEVLLTRPDIRADVQRSCTHLLVDEFQDLTPAFLLLLRLAAGPSMQVFAVGDDDQVIYSYAGATPDYLIDIDRWFPGTVPHALEVNYRCPPEVVDAAVTLLGHNRRRVPKVIRAADAASAEGVA